LGRLKVIAYKEIRVRGHKFVSGVFGYGTLAQQSGSSSQQSALRKRHN
jgi:hypothetical protein